MGIFIESIDMIWNFINMAKFSGTCTLVEEEKNIQVCLNMLAHINVFFKHITTVHIKILK